MSKTGTVMGLFMIIMGVIAGVYGNALQKCFAPVGFLLGVGLFAFVLAGREPEIESNLEGIVFLDTPHHQAAQEEWDAYYYNSGRVAEQNYVSTGNTKFLEDARFTASTVSAKTREMFMSNMSPEFRGMVARGWGVGKTHPEIKYAVDDSVYPQYVQRVRSLMGRITK